jgi:hypothetical protein
MTIPEKVAAGGTNETRERRYSYTKGERGATKKKKTQGFQKSIYFALHNTSTVY